MSNVFWPTESSTIIFEYHKCISESDKDHESNAQDMFEKFSHSSLPENIEMHNYCSHEIYVQNNDNDYIRNMQCEKQNVFNCLKNDR